MSTLTSTLAVRLLDDVSGPAGKAAGALRGLGASGADLKKLAAASPETARLVRELERLKAVAGKVDTFKVASRGLDDMGLNLKKARADLTQAEHLLARRQKTVEYFNRIKVENPERYAKWKMDGLTAGVASNLDKAKRARDKAAKAIEPAKSEFMDQGRHVRTLRNELGALGLPLNGLKAAEAGLKTSIDATNAAIAKQPALLAAAEAKAHDLARASKEQLRAAVEAGKAAQATRQANAVRTARVERARVEVQAARPKLAEDAVAKVKATGEARKAARVEADPILNPERGVADLRKVPELGKAVAARRALQAQAGAIEDFRVDARGLKQVSQAYRLAQQDLRKLKAEMASAPSDAVASKLAEAHAAVARTSAAFQAQGAAVRSSRAALAEAGVGVNQLKSAETGLAASIGKATAELQRQTTALGQNAKAQAKAAERAAARKDAAGALGAGAAVVAGYKGKEIGKKAVVSAAEFDIGVRKQRYFNGLDTEQQAPLIAQAKRIGQETQFSNLDVVKAQTKSMQGLPASFGPELKAQVAQGILENVRNYATVMEADLETSAEGIRSYLQTTGKDISTKEKALAEAQKATNQLVKMAKLGGMNDEDVQQFMKFAGGSGTTSGLTTESLMSLGALARRGGLRGDEAGTFIRSASSKLVSPTRPGLAAMNAAGINHSDYVSMPERLSTAALENQFKTTLGKGFTDEVRKRLDVVNADKDLIKDRANYTKAVTDAVAPILGKKKDGTVRASDTQTAAKAAGIFHKVSQQSVDAERLLDDMMSKNMTLAQLNAVLTDKHGGKGAITQRQWDEFKASREGIKKAGDDPNLAADMAKGIMAGLGGSLENLKGSIDNLILTIGTANEGWLKTAMDAGGSAVDTFSKLPPGAQQALSIGAGAGVLAASTYGTTKLLTTLLGGSSGVALSASAVALDGSAAALTAAAARLGASSAAGVVSGAATGAATAGAGAATAGGVSLGLGGSLILGGAVAGAAIDSATPGTNAGITGLVNGAESSLEQTNRVLREERARAEITARLGPQAWETGRPRTMPDADAGKGYASEVPVSRGAIGDFLLGQRKEAVALPAMPSGPAKVLPSTPSPGKPAGGPPTVEAYRPGAFSGVPGVGTPWQDRGVSEHGLLDARAHRLGAFAGVPGVGTPWQKRGVSEHGLLNAEADRPGAFDAMPGVRTPLQDRGVSEHPLLSTRPLPAPAPAPGVVPRIAAPAAAADLAARDPRRLAEPPVPDVAAIQAATAALAAYRAELANVSANLATGLDMPGIGTGLEARKSELEGLIAGVEAKLQGLGAQTIAPQVDAAPIEGLGTSATAAGEKLAGLNTTVSPQVDMASLSALDALLTGILGKVRQLGPAMASAKAQAASISVPSAGSGGGRTAEAAPARSAGVRQALANNFT